MGNWPCSCPSSSDGHMLQMAMYTFGGNAPNGKPYVFRYGDDGTSEIKGFFGIDCSHLVSTVLGRLGYFPPIGFLRPSFGTQKMIDPNWSMYRSLFFCKGVKSALGSCLVKGSSLLLAHVLPLDI
jgi:hypothetical protein